MKAEGYATSEMEETTQGSGGVSGVREPWKQRPRIEEVIVKRYWMAYRGENLRTGGLNRNVPLQPGARNLQGWRQFR